MGKTYQLELSPGAKKDLKRLPNNIQKEIVFKRLPEIVKDPFATSEPLLPKDRGVISTTSIQKKTRPLLALLAWHLLRTSTL